VRRANVARAARPFPSIGLIASASDEVPGYDHNADNPPWIKALADVRRRGTLEGYCCFHVQAIMPAIDQYAESALGNRKYFLNKRIASAKCGRQPSEIVTVLRFDEFDGETIGQKSHDMADAGSNRQRRSDLRPQLRGYYGTGKRAFAKSSHIKIVSHYPFFDI
jgi:hypothetical protein